MHSLMGNGEVLFSHTQKKGLKLIPKVPSSTTSQETPGSFHFRAGKVEAWGEVSRFSQQMVQARQEGGSPLGQQGSHTLGPLGVWGALPGFRNRPT